MRPPAPLRAEHFAYGPRSWGSRHPRAVLWMPVAVSFLFQVVPVLFPTGFWIGEPDGYGSDWLIGLLIMLIGPVALIAARRHPGVVVAVVAAAATAALLVGNQTLPPYFALGFAIVSAIVRRARVWAWVSVGAAWALSLWFSVAIGTLWHPSRIAAITLAILVVFGIGEGLRSRREHLQEFARSFAQRQQVQLQAERVRIARELHDVLAHSLSQINVQAGVGLHLMDTQPDQARQALSSIKQSSKSALDEVRSVLGALRSDDGSDPNAPLVPEPDLGRLDGLAASVTTQGVAVTVHNTVGSTPPAAVQLALYRIVQESLTNVVRHAAATTAAVSLREEGDQVVVEISDNGRGTVGAVSEGRGLLGMRERAELLGGSLTAGSHAKGFTVSAQIPIEGARS